MKKTSPVISTIKPVTMNFNDALKQALNDKFITRLEWNNLEVYGLMVNGYLSLNIDGEIKNWIVRDVDITAEDWVTL